jgi:hypothetical protein
LSLTAHQKVSKNYKKLKKSKILIILKIQNSQKTIKMPFHVTYSESYYQNQLEYVCNIIKVDLRASSQDNMTGRHINGKSDNDVTMLSFVNCTFNKVPQLGLKFLNLKIFNISRSNLRKLTMNDMDTYRNVEIIDINKTGLKFLPGNLFTGFEKLKEIYLNDNQLSSVEPNILDGLNNLRIVDFRQNCHYNHYYSDAEMEMSEFRKILIRSFLRDNFENAIKYIENLQKNNQELRDENEELSAKLETADEFEMFPVADYGYMKYYEELSELAEQNSKLEEKIQELTETPKGQLQGDLNCFMQDESTKEFKIIIEGQEFPVHKFLLAARSPTLAELLKNNPEVENLNLVDISVEIFEKILKFLYTDEFPGDNGTNFLHVFGAAGKLQIPKLMSFAAQKLLEMSDYENPLEVLLLSNKYGNEELKQKAFVEVKKKYPNVELKEELADNVEKLTEFMKIMKIKEEAEMKMKEFINN